MERLTLKLAYPLSIDQGIGEGRQTVTVEEVSLAPRIKGRHMLAAQHAESQMQARLLVLMSLAGLPREYADEFDEQDLAAMDALTGGETADMRRVALALGIAEASTVDQILSAIAKLKASPSHTSSESAAERAAGMVSAPLDGGDSQADGRPSGSNSFAT